MKCRDRSKIANHFNARRAGGIWLVEASSLRNYIANAPKPGPKPEASEE